MAGIDGLDQDQANKTAFMEMQQQAALGMSHHQAYSSIRSSYAQGAAHEAFSGQAARPLGGYPFAAMNNSPLHNTYSHHPGHYLGNYPPNVTSCAPCPSPPRDGKLFACGASAEQKF